MTEEQKRHVLRSECPFCGYCFSQYDEVEVDSGETYQAGSCSQCGARWQEVYTLSRIDRTDGKDE